MRANSTPNGAKLQLREPQSHTTNFVLFLSIQCHHLSLIDNHGKIPVTILKKKRIKVKLLHFNRLKLKLSNIVHQLYHVG